MGWSMTDSTLKVRKNEYGPFTGVLPTESLVAAVILLAIAALPHAAMPKKRHTSTSKLLYSTVEPFVIYFHAVEF